MTKFTLSAAAIAAGLIAAPAFANTMATASTDLNIRSGPGPWYDVVGVISSDAEVDVAGCLEAENWCKVVYDGTEGWSYGSYLTATMDETVYALTAPEFRQAETTTTVTYEDTSDASATAGAGFGTVVGALVGGPVGAAVGATVGATTMAIADPGPQVVSYVTENPVDPVYLDGEVVVGAGIPAEVELVAVPEAEFSYVNVNGLPVIVETEQRTIVQVVR